jgi:hypothetical protein
MDRIIYIILALTCYRLRQISSSVWRLDRLSGRGPRSARAHTDIHLPLLSLFLICLPLRLRACMDKQGACALSAVAMIDACAFRAQPLIMKPDELASRWREMIARCFPSPLF